jgi:hypothetical protein
LNPEILKLDGFCETYCQIKRIFPSIMTLITSLIFLKTHSHAKMAPDIDLKRESWPRAFAGTKFDDAAFTASGLLLAATLRAGAPPFNTPSPAKPSHHSPRPSEKISFQLVEHRILDENAPRADSNSRCSLPALSTAVP